MPVFSKVKAFGGWPFTLVPPGEKAPVPQGAMTLLKSQRGSLPGPGVGFASKRPLQLLAYFLMGKRRLSRDLELWKDLALNRGSPG